MPKILEVNGFKFYFWSDEGSEPIHVHIIKGDGKAKVWLEPEIIWEYSKKFTIRDQRAIRKIIDQNIDILINSWNEYFEQNK